MSIHLDNGQRTAVRVGTQHGDRHRIIASQYDRYRANPKDRRDRLSDPCAIAVGIAGVRVKITKINNAAWVTEGGKQSAANIKIELIELTVELL
jgi:hypothetical protein